MFGTVVDNVLCQCRTESGDIGQQMFACRVDIHANQVHATFHRLVEALFQGALLDVMLVLPDTDAFRIDLDQLGKRIHQAAADADGATDRHVIFGKLVAGDLGGGIDGRSVLADHKYLHLAVVADIGDELFRLAACRPIPDSDGVDSVCGDQLCHFGSRFAFFVLGRVRIDRFIM